MSSVTKSVAVGANAGLGVDWVASAGTLGDALAAHGGATVSSFVDGSTSKTLAATMGANHFAIPSGSQINGIKVEIEGSASIDDVDEVTVRLLKAGVWQLTTRSAAGSWPLAPAYISYGGAADLWNDFGEVWTSAAVNDENFGVAVVVGGPPGATATIDHVRITVYYTEATMSTTFSGDLRISAGGVFTNALDLDNVTDALSLSITESLTNGTGANKAQIQWHDQRTLATVTPETLDLTALAGAAFGTANFSKIKRLIIQVITATSGYRLEVGAAGGNDWAGTSQLLKDASDIIRCCAGGIYVFTCPVDGWTVDGTHKALKINNVSGGSVTYNIIIQGEGTVA